LYSATWEENVSKESIMNTSKDALLVLDGNLIMKNQIIDLNLLTIDYVLSLYIPHLLDIKTYESTSIITNAYYETAPYTGKVEKIRILETTNL
jgi:hypothetical protein